MKSENSIRVLVVDDSVIFRELIAKKLSEDPRITVVAKASDPFDARDKIIEFEPDIMTLDIEMPKMSGIEFLKRLLPQYPMPVVMVSSADKAVFDAISAGAVDFVLKPKNNRKADIDLFANELIYKIIVSTKAKISFNNNTVFENIKESTYSSDKIIAIGSSTGGTEAVYNILRRLHSKMPGILIVQHMPPVFTRLFAERLNSNCSMEVREAKSGDKVYPGLALIAPGDLHMKLRKNSLGYFVECYEGEKVNGHCPSADVLFESVAKAAGKNALGVILTGMGSDGAKGLLSMRKNGAKTIGQSEKSCIVYGMPKVAFEIGAVEKQSDLGNIPNLIHSYLSNERV